VEFQLKIKPEWDGEPAIVAASGPSLTPDVIKKCRMTRWLDGWRVLAINDVYKVMPWADALYAADMSWWNVHKGAEPFHGRRYTSTCPSPLEYCDDKRESMKQFPKVTLVNATAGAGFSNNPNCIHYGEPGHSGFQAVNLALLLGARLVVLVGFDYRFIDGKAHFFGDHPNGIRQFEESKTRELAKAFNTAPCARILNATPGSLVSAYPNVGLDDVCQQYSRLHRDRPVTHARAD
jgi:hypothetical protein